jgi:hypothetical protein
MPVPDVFGVYAVVDGRLEPIPPVETRSAGNLINESVGVAPESLPSIGDDISALAVFVPSRSIEKLQIRALEFQQGATLETPLGRSYYPTGFWTGGTQITLDKGVLKPARGIFFALPKNRLLPGRYVVDFGELGVHPALEAANRPSVYPFRIIPRGTQAIEGAICLPPLANSSKLALVLKDSAGRRSKVPLTLLPEPAKAFLGWPERRFEAIAPQGLYAEVSSSFAGRPGCIASSWTSCVGTCSVLDEDCLQRCGKHVPVSVGGPTARAPLQLCDCIAPCAPTASPSDQALIAQALDPDAAVRRAAAAEVLSHRIPLSKECLGLLGLGSN